MLRRYYLYTISVVKHYYNVAKMFHVLTTWII